MAAVLYEIEEQKEPGRLTEESGSNQAEEEMEDIIGNIPETELRSFVKQLAGQDDEIRNTLMTRYVVRIDEKQMYRRSQKRNVYMVYQSFVMRLCFGLNGRIYGRFSDL